MRRFTAPLWPHYKGVGTHGFSVWARGALGDVMRFRSPCHDKNGSHWMVKEGGIFGRAGGQGAGWHPPAGMHLLRGEVLAYNYVHILIDAMYMVEIDLAREKERATATTPILSSSSSSSSSSSLSSLSKSSDAPVLFSPSARSPSLSLHYQSILDSLQVPIPTKPLYCSPDCDTKPLCFTNFKPHYNPEFSLDSIIVGNHTGWASVDKLGSGGKDERIYGWLDRRPCYEAQGPNHFLHLTIAIAHANISNHVRVCGYSSKESLKHAVFWLDAHVKTLPGPDYASPPTSVLRALDKRKYAQDECTLLHDLPVGRHVLNIQTNPNATTHVTSLSHVIYFS